MRALLQTFPTGVVDDEEPCPVGLLADDLDAMERRRDRLPIRAWTGTAAFHPRDRNRPISTWDRRDRLDVKRCLGGDIALHHLADRSLAGDHLVGRHHKPWHSARIGLPPRRGLPFPALRAKADHTLRVSVLAYLSPPWFRVNIASCSHNAVPASPHLIAIRTPQPCGSQVKERGETSTTRRALGEHSLELDTFTSLVVGR